MRRVLRSRLAGRIRYPEARDLPACAVRSQSPWCVSASCTRCCALWRVTAGESVGLCIVAEQAAVLVGRRAARAILIDDVGRLVLIKRTKPGQAPYWTAPGGGVEDADASAEAALYRELTEELGAEAADASQVFLVSSPSDAGVAVQHFFVARLVELDESARSGPEFSDPTRGGYDVDRVDLHSDDLASVDLKPSALKDFILANREALLVEAGVSG